MLERAATQEAIGLNQSRLRSTRPSGRSSSPSWPTGVAAIPACRGRPAIGVGADAYFNRPSRLSLPEVTWLQRPCSHPASHTLKVRIDGNGDVTCTHRVWKRDNVGVFVSSLAEYKDRIYLMLPRVRGFV
jgi:hypothetical protein